MRGTLQRPERRRLEPFPGRGKQNHICPQNIICEEHLLLSKCACRQGASTVPCFPVAESSRLPICFAWLRLLRQCVHGDLGRSAVFLLLVFFRKVCGSYDCLGPGFGQSLRVAIFVRSLPSNYFAWLRSWKTLLLGGAPCCHASCCPSPPTSKCACARLFLRHWLLCSGRPAAPWKCAFLPQCKQAYRCHPVETPDWKQQAVHPKHARTLLNCQCMACALATAGSMSLLLRGQGRRRVMKGIKMGAICGAPQSVVWILQIALERTVKAPISVRGFAVVNVKVLRGFKENNNANRVKLNKECAKTEKV